ncbi:MAG: lon [Deltaproteobacteria bacterium]|nr:lon [Deltaproteobacteria bacterium]
MTDSISIPDILPIYPQSELVAFPHMQITLYLKEQDLPLFEECRNYGNLVVVCKYRSEYRGNLAEAVHEIGTVCHVTEFTRLSADGGVTVTMEGLARCRLVEVTREPPLALGHVEVAREFVEKSVVTDALVASLSALLKIALSYGRPLPKDVMKMVDYIDTPTRLADLVALYCDLSLDELQDMLETLDPVERLKKVYLHLTEAVQRLQVKGEIQHEVSQRLGKTQKEYLLREQMKQIQEELGEEDPKNSELHELRKKLESASMPADVRTIADREIQRLERMNPSSPEHNIIRTYLDYLAGMPWQTSTLDNKDINEAERILDADHYNLKEVKERILEYLAVRSVKEKMKGPILCFVGPPGVGKTSLGKSIARALGRKFIRMSLGGMRDEAEIRGHRRTYIGALPGRILQEIFRAGSNNPVFMLDEVDKIGIDFRGDPASALLEVLDPEQNSTFTDHYLDVPFDLSKVMFITTANQLDPVPSALKDRMEVLTLSGYTTEEKGAIADRYLIPREIDENGLAEHPPAFLAEAVQNIICSYTREAGVRNLQRNIASICRKVTKEFTQGKPVRTEITAAVVEEFLGARKFINEVAAEQDRVGVVTGLAWTESGGDIIFVEATRMHGKAELILTGSLGDVMKESARAALSFVEANREELGIDADAFAESIIHVHVPAGSIPKDGPSAGITIATALVSLLKGVPARRDVAMTGEITLTGRVLPIGGLKEKALAARRAGVKTLLVPERNRDAMENIPETVKNDLEFIFIEDAREALHHALQQP